MGGIIGKVKPIFGGVGLTGRILQPAGFRLQQAVEFSLIRWFGLGRSAAPGPVGRDRRGDLPGWGGCDLVYAESLIILRSSCFAPSWGNIQLRKWRHMGRVGGKRPERMDNVLKL
jgi:hypothetical protein